MIKKCLLIPILLFSLFYSVMAVPLELERELLVNKILVLSIHSSINPATLSYLREGMERAKREGFQSVLIKMNTPGGLVSTTKDILTLFGEYSIPMIVWITPEGASATSAGAIISSGAHLLFMSPGTNIGAATPITLSGDLDGEKKQNSREEKEEELDEKAQLKKSLEQMITPKGEKEKKGSKSNSSKDMGSDLKKKAINDLVALVKSLSSARGRNGEMFAEMIKNASSFEAEVALKKGLINGMCNTLEELLKALEGKEIILHGEKIRLKLPSEGGAQAVRSVEHKMDLGQVLLDVFANPSLAYILFILGAALIYLEFQAPGGFVAGASGAICLLLSGIAFQVLPLNFGALGLIILSFVLFLLETYVSSYGLLVVAGLVSLVFGSLFLYRSDSGYLDFNYAVVYSTVLAVGLFIGFITFYWIWDASKQGGVRRRFKRKEDHHEIVGKKVTVIAVLPEGNRYQVKLQGELWNAYSPLTEHYKEGEELEVISIDVKKLLVEVKK
ncbi:MAG: nodulation protein NfeD [Oligoflexia bacterium]|nr:nodulation protein NfeD [Oligoflexia bacterium]